MSKWTPYQHGVSVGGLHGISHTNDTLEQVRKAADEEADRQDYVHGGRADFKRGYVTGFNRVARKWKERLAQ